jgi:queuine/archaeosine tRNA-ribosyltransferase
MTIDVRPQGNATASARTPAGSAQGNRQRNMILVGIGAGAVYRLVRNHSFHISVVTAAIGLAAIGHIAKENNTKTMQQLVAWAKKQDARLEHKVKHAAGQAKGALPG